LTARRDGFIHSLGVDIPTFLRKYPPFDDLDEDTLDRVARNVQIELFEAGMVILLQSGEPSHYLYVIRTGAVEILDGTLVLDLLTEGEVFGQFSLLSGLGPSFTVRALEDTLCYLIEGDLAREVLGTRRGLAFLSATLRRREIRAVEGGEMARIDPGTAAVGSLLRRPPVTCSATATVREAAEIMASQRVSSLLIPRPPDWGIVTDRDLRTRVLAQGRGPDTIVGEIMSHPAHTIPADALVAEVVFRMLELGVHHLPVVDGNRQVLGVVTDTDLLGMEQKNPFTLKSAIERAATVDAVVAVAREMPETICTLVEARVDPIHVSQVVAVTIDTVSRRLLEIGISELGSPPAPWAWLALGSEARQEQALLTDQDHALAYDPGEDPAEMVDPYFAKLAPFVTDGLEGMGIRRCRAGVIASNREWRRPVSEWLLQFRKWMDDPGRTGSAYTGIAFDFRRVAGPLDAEPVLQGAIRNAPTNAMFMRHLARIAVDPRPPTGFFRDLVVQAKGAAAGHLDVKHGGVTLVTNLARFYALGAGLTENRTLQRLRGAVAAGRINEETRAALEEAFRLLWQIRLEHQSTQVRRGTTPDDDVEPGSLGPLTRQGLKEAFRIIDEAQRAVAAETGVRDR
jgi:CBS domain-containing protein